MSDSDVPVPTLKPKKKRKSKNQRRRKRLPRYHVVLWNDEEHTFDYVITMLKDLFGHSTQLGYKLAKRVDRVGKAVVFTTHLELAELKRDQIHAYGPGKDTKSNTGSMWATIEKGVE